MMMMMTMMIKHCKDNSHSEDEYAESVLDLNYDNDYEY